MDKFIKEKRITNNIVGRKKIAPNLRLQKFYEEHCEDVPFDSPQVFFRLLEEIIKLKSENNNSKQDGKRRENEARRDRDFH